MKIYALGLLLVLLRITLSFPQEISKEVISVASIPALSYHNVTERKGKNEAYFITPETFEAHIRTLKNQGFNTVLPEDLYEFSVNGQLLPEKPILISFDDTRKEHYTTVAPILEKYGFRGTFFIMTVSLGKMNYMTKEEIKDLSDRGHAIGLHTWDHQDLRKLPADQWTVQIEKPKLSLEKTLENPVVSLAYPFGAWNQTVIGELKKRGILLAFQLAGKADPTEPLYTLRRILVPGNWSGNRLINEIESQFQ